MDRHELMRMIALATGLSLAGAGFAEAGSKGEGRNEGRGEGARQERGSEGKAKGHEKHEKEDKPKNPKSHGGPEHPGKGHHHHYRG